MLNSLQGLRVIGMLLIFLSHCGILIGTKYENVFYTLFYEGYCAVTFFFILSGFMTYKSLSKRKIDITLKGSIIFTINKIKKFYPLHIIILIFILIINFKYGNNIKQIILSIPNILLLQSFIPIKSIYFGFNGVTWYLSSLVLCYLLSNLFTYLIKNLDNKKLLYYIILIYIVQFSLVYLNRNIDNSHYIFYINPLWRSIDFLIGMILCKILLNTSYLDRFDVIKTTYIELIVTLVFMIMYFISRYIHSIFKYGVYYTPIFILIISVFYYQKGILSKVIGNSFIVSLSDISFEFYMIHQVIIRMVNSVLGGKPVLSVIVAFFTSIFIATILKKILKIVYNYKHTKNMKCMN